MDTAFGVGLAAVAASVTGAFFTWRSSSRATDVSDRTEDRAWVAQIKQDAYDARKELGDARKEIEVLRQQVSTLSSQMRAMTQETDYWISQYQLVHRSAWREGMTLSRLRQLIGPEPPASPGVNG